MMEYKDNAAVVRADGKPIGHIDRVVIDPKSKEVTHLVVKKGLLFTREKVLPVDQIESATEDRVVLRESAPDPESLPDFENTRHISAVDLGGEGGAKPGFVRPLMWYDPRASVPWWGPADYPGYSVSPYVTKTTRNIPEGAKPLEEGAKVIDKDNHKLGKIEEIYTEASENRATHILVSSGLVTKEKKLVPTNWIETVFEDEIKLSVGKNIFEKLPDFTSS